jgi:hypothetical protein
MGQGGQDVGHKEGRDGDHRGKDQGKPETVQKGGTFKEFDVVFKTYYFHRKPTGIGQGEGKKQSPYKGKIDKYSKNDQTG